MKATKLVLGSVVSFLIALGCDAVANAYTFRIDSFRIIRNGNLFFEDAFSDGSPPPSAPNFPNGNAVSYFVLGTLGPESGGKLTIDSLGATAVGSITGVGAFMFQQARLLTSTDSSNLATGLKIDDTFAVTAVFDLLLPSATIEGYGISLTDRTLAEGNDDLRLEVRRNTAGSVRVSFIRADATANTFTILATALIDVSHQQIALTLSRPTTTNTQIVGSFAYVDGGVQGPTTTFPVSSTIFHNENFTRAQFFAETPLFPTDLRPTPGDQLVDLRWNSFTQGVRGWNVYFRQKSTVSWNRIANIGNPTDPQVPTTNQLFYRVDRNPINGQKLLTNGISYEFSVTAVTNSGDESLKSSIVEALPNAQNNSPNLPVLFLHGIGVNARTWDSAKSDLEKKGWKFGGELGIVSYGVLCPDLTNLRRSTYDNPCASFGILVPGEVKADFYTATFFNNNANYDNGKGIIQQGREVRAFLQRLRQLFPSGQKFRIVAHSMGGLAARSYMSGLDTSYEGDVYQLVTYGTPHTGTPVRHTLEIPIIGLLIEEFLRFVKGVDIDRGGDGIMNMDPPSLFLSQLSSKSLAPSKYTSIVSFAPYPCFGSPEFDFHISESLGPSHDCIVPTVSQDLRSIPVVNPDIRSQMGIVLANRIHTEETTDVTRITCALGECLVVVSKSPVDLEVTDPNGFRISKSLNEIPGASYEEFDIDGDGELNDVITIPFALAGDYQIRVIPDSEANPSETYSLETNINGVTTILAQNQRLQDIPTQPFLVDVPLSVNIDIKPGGIPNSIQRRSQGRIPIAILSTDNFDAPARVNRVSLTFGHAGDETSLDFCNPGSDDVNGDGLPDLVCHFRTQRTDFQVGDIEGVLKGQTVDGIFLRGTDSVRILQ